MANDSETGFQLRAIAGPETGKVYPLTQRVSVGRHPDSDILITDSTVARIQCVLLWDEVELRHGVDRGWYRPVFVSESQVKEGECILLSPGDELRIAETVFVYEAVS